MGFIDPFFVILGMAIRLYIYAVVISAILSWLVSFRIVNTSNRLVYMIVDFLYRITEPALRPIRRFIPSLGGVDISPIILIFLLYFIEMELGSLRIWLLSGQ